MKRALYMIGLLMLCSGCYKDEVVIAELNNNPFDPDYVGAMLFTLDTVLLEPAPAPPGGVRHAMKFSVNSSRFLTPTSYQVYVKDLVTGDESFLGQFPLGSDSFTYYRSEISGDEVCLELRLANELSVGRAETVCGTL
ncbi:MAG: hypothetical protein KDB88_04030 [Flavobacteriales bacterium]|nr:hypothetical protein [Flavobacteriales bacterium]